MMTKTSPGASRRPKSKHSRHRYTRKSVLKMLKVMSEETDEAKDATKDFLTTGRVGRRNAMADILGEHARISTSDLPEKLNNLTTKDSGADQPETSEADKTRGQEEAPTVGPSGPKS